MNQLMYKFTQVNKEIMIVFKQLLLYRHQMRIMTSDLFFASITQEDLVVLKFKNLKRKMKIARDCIVYRYLHNTVEIYYNTRHQHYPNTTEFFSTITYLGRRRTFSFVKRPMFFEQDRSFEDNFYDACMK